MLMRCLAARAVPLAVRDLGDLANTGPKLEVPDDGNLFLVAHSAIGVKGKSSRGMHNGTKILWTIVLAGRDIRR